MKSSRSFCFLCGKKTDTLIDSYCQECYDKEFKITKFPKKIEVTECSKCKRMHIENRWVESTIEEALKNKIKAMGKIESVNIEEKEPKKFEVTVKGYAKGSGNLKEERLIIPVHIVRLVCPTCSRKYGGYYEAVIQLRGERLTKALEFIDERMTEIEAKDPKAFYFIEDAKGGLDFKIGSKKAANKLADMIRREFKTDLKKSYKLVTRKDGNDVYRTYIAIRI